MIDERPTAYDGLAHIILTCSLISLVALLVIRAVPILAAGVLPSQTASRRLLLLHLHLLEVVQSHRLRFKRFSGFLFRLVRICLFSSGTSFVVARRNRGIDQGSTSHPKTWETTKPTPYN